MLPLTLGLGLAALTVVENGSLGPQTENGRLVVHQKNSWARLIQMDSKAQRMVAGNPLKTMMSADDLDGKNPFSDLLEDQALLDAMADVKSVERTTLRSSNYRDEAGYDLIHYEVRHANGSVSQIVAQVDYNQPFNRDTLPKLENPKESIVVLVLNPVADEQYQLTQFRDGLAVEGLNVPKSRGEARVAQRLDQAIPFLSVSR